MPGKKKNSKRKVSGKGVSSTRVKKLGKMSLKMDFVSSNVLSSKDEKNRIRYILDKVKDGTILVTDGVLTHDEELNLIRETMRRVDDGFPGIEVASLKRETSGYQRIIEQAFDQSTKIQGFISKIQGRDVPIASLKYGITLIGPSKIIKEIRKNPDSFSVFAQS